MSKVSISLMERMREISKNKKEYTFLGAGGSARVFQINRTDQVLKFLYREDSGYENFIKVISNYSSPHFPKVYNIKDYGEDGKVYTLERLYELTNDSDLELTKILAKYSRNNTRFLHKTAIERLENYPSLVEAIDYLKISRVAGSLWDLGYSNIMCRIDKTLVITDPWC